MTEKRPLSVRMIDLVRRTLRAVLDETQRTRRTIVAPESRKATERPIFVIGVHRSGTTLVRLILDSHSRIACPPESFFLLPETRVLSDRKALEGLLAMGFQPDHVRARLREHVAYFFELYAASHGKARWADKTPSYVDCLDELELLFPDAQYVFVYRNGLDSACSIARIPDIPEAEPHVAACGGDRFAGAARYWATQCGVMRAFAARVPGRVFALFYERLVADPEPETRKLFAFLGEAFEPGVLAFYDQPHDRWAGHQDIKAVASRGFQPNVGAWKSEPAERVKAMLEQAGAELRALGYDDTGARP
jgi:protein-tyrosine sulfotransferase